MKRAGKRVAGWIGGVSGVATPGWLYFKNYTPPLFPGITWLVAALSVAIWFLVWRGSIRRRAAAVQLIVAVLLLFIYALLLQFTTLTAAGNPKQRVQIGFGTVSWTLTQAGNDWMRAHPSSTAFDLASSDAAFVQHRVPKLWQTWSVYCAGALATLVYVLAFVLWSSGFANLGLGEPDENPGG
jgi:hypothetical protein